MPTRLATFLALTLAFAAATWLAGWWAVPVVAFAVGLVPRPHGGARRAALAATLAWGALLAFAAAGPAFDRVLRALGGLAPLPAATFVVATLALAPLLAWSAAALGAALPLRRGAPAGHGAAASPAAARAAPAPEVAAGR
jgi:hypothetical protein